MAKKSKSNTVKSTPKCPICGSECAADRPPIRNARGTTQFEHVSCGKCHYQFVFASRMK